MRLGLALSRLLRRLVVLPRRIGSDRRGNVLMILGLALIPMTFSVGMGIDYARAARLQTKLNALADAAALSAVTTPMMSQSTSNAAVTASHMFYEQANGTWGFQQPYYSCCVVSQTSSSFDGADGTIRIIVTDTTTSNGNKLRTAAFTWHAASKNVFGTLLGMSQIEMSGGGTAKSGGDIYYQIVFVVDVSNSMGVGGTASDITKLTNDRTIQCAFACHDPNGTIGVAATDYCDGHPADYFCHTNGPAYCPYGTGNCAIYNPSRTYSDRRGLAKLYGYKLKIDYVNDAITSFINQLAPKMNAAPSQFSVAIDTFGTSFAQIQAPTNSVSTLQTAAASIDLEVAARSPAGYANQGWTYTTTGLQTALSKITNIGNGSSPTARKTFVVFLSDGVEDIFDNPGYMYNRKTTLDYVTACQNIQAAGASMFSIQAAYPAITGDSQYDVLVGNLPSRYSPSKTIDQAMQQCASSTDKYFYASDGPGITTAVSNVFSAIFTPVRLTN